MTSNINGKARDLFSVIKYSMSKVEYMTEINIRHLEKIFIMTGEERVYFPLTTKACVTNPGPLREGTLGILKCQLCGRKEDTTKIEDLMTLTL